MTVVKSIVADCAFGMTPNAMPSIIECNDSANTNVIERVPGNEYNDYT
jgi:hypothetical protein